MKHDKLDFIYPLRLSRGQYELVQKLAEHEDRTAASVIRLALKGYLKKCSRRERRGDSDHTDDALAG